MSKNLVIYVIAGEANYVKLNDEDTAKFREIEANGEGIKILSVEPYRRGMKIDYQGYPFAK